MSNRVFHTGNNVYFKTIHTSQPLHTPFFFFQQQNKMKSFVGLSLLSPILSLPLIQLKQKPTGERVFIEVENNREVFFHGVNAIVKGFPYLPEINTFDIDTSLSKEDHETLADLGVNVYRLGSMWKGLEPTRGRYEEEYMQGLNQIINEAEQYGIYTLLDMHQVPFLLFYLPNPFISSLSHSSPFPHFQTPFFFFFLKFSQSHFLG